MNDLNKNPYWREGYCKISKRRYVERIEDGFREYAMDEYIANYILDLRRGRNGHNKHTMRALAMAVIGLECQISGQELIRIAEWTLNDYDEFGKTDYVKVPIKEDNK